MLELCVLKRYDLSFASVALKTPARFEEKAISKEHLSKGP